MIYILTDAIETGKSSALLQWTQGRTAIFGVLSPKNDFKERYFLDVHTGASFKMEANAEDKDVILVGRYTFLQSAFKKANSIIKNAVEHTTSGFIIIDEIGKLEMRSEGLHESASAAITIAMHHEKLHVILIVRTSLIDGTIEKYKIMNPNFITREQLLASNLENVTNVTKINRQ